MGKQIDYECQIICNSNPENCHYRVLGSVKCWDFFLFLFVVNNKVLYVMRGSRSVLFFSLGCEEIFLKKIYFSICFAKTLKTGHLFRKKARSSPSLTLNPET